VQKREPSRQYLKALLGVATSALVVLFSVGASGERPTSVQGNGAEAGPHVAIRDAQAITVAYVGSQGAVQVLESGRAQPLSLAGGDFNEDGVKDLVAGYAAPDGSGIIALHLGNLDAFAPQSYESWLSIGRGQFPAPFQGAAAVLQIPHAPDFLATGNFTGSGHVDVLTAARGDKSLYLLAGDGLGSFATAQAMPLPGAVTAMAAGRFGAGTSRSTVIVGIGGRQPAALLYSTSAGGLSLLGRYALTAPPTAFFFDDLDGDGLPDVVMIAGGQVSILHAMGSSGPLELEPLSLPVSAVTFTTGFFVHDRSWRRQIAVLDQAGAINIVAHGGFDSRGWTKAEVKAMRDALLHHQPNPFARTESGPVRDGWKVIETVSGTAPSGGSGRLPLLLSSRISGGGTDDVLVLDSQAGQMAVAAHPWVGSGASSFTPASLASRVYSAGVPVAALAFPVNVDAREGLVVLHQGQTAISVMMPVPGARSKPASRSPTRSSSSGPQPGNAPILKSSVNHREGQ
jgi:hypothetical protein